jgi:hypothetical protein
MPDTYTYSRTRNQIIVKVLRKHGVIEAGATPLPADSDLVSEALDLRLKEMHKLGVLWYQVLGAQTDVALVGGTVTASTPADFLFAVSMSIRISGDDVPLEIIGHREYQAIPTKTDTGEPSKVFISGQACRFWPVPDIAYTAKLTYQAIAADSIDATAPDIEISMVRSLCNLLAYDVADEYSVPEGKLQRMAQEAVIAERTIKNLSSERVDVAPVVAEYF